MKKLLQILTCLFALSITQVKSQITFGKTYGTINNDFGYSVAKTFDGGYIIESPHNNGNWGVIKTNSLGDTVWTKNYSFLPTNANYQITNSIIQTSDSNYVLVGALPDSNSFIMKVNSLGDTLWCRMSGHGSFPIHYYDVAENENGNLIIVGEVFYGTSVCCAPWIIKTDNNGNTIANWSIAITCPTSNGCRLQKIYIDAEGNYLVTGDAPYPNAPAPRLIKLDTSGNVLWNKYYLVLGNSSISGIVQTPDSGYLLVGPNWVGEDSTLVYKTDYNGNLQWLNKYRGNSTAWQGASVDTTNGGYLIAGGYQNIFLMKLDLNYALLWSREFGGALDETCAQMLSTSDGGCIIVGSTQSFGLGGYDAYLIKTDQNGLMLGQKEIEIEDVLSIAPNPFSNQTTLQFSKTLRDATLSLYNSYGQQVKQLKNCSGQTIVLQREYLPSGIYFAQLIQDYKIIATEKIVITDK